MSVPSSILGNHLFQFDSSLRWLYPLHMICPLKFSVYFSLLHLQKFRKFHNNSHKIDGSKVGNDLIVDAKEMD